MVAQVGVIDVLHLEIRVRSASKVHFSRAERLDKIWATMAHERELTLDPLFIQELRVVNLDRALRPITALAEVDGGGLTET